MRLREDFESRVHDWNMRKAALGFAATSRDAEKFQLPLDLEERMRVINQFYSSLLMATPEVVAPTQVGSTAVGSSEEMLDAA